MQETMANKIPRNTTKGPEHLNQVNNESRNIPDGLSSFLVIVTSIVRSTWFFCKSTSTGARDIRNARMPGEGQTI